MTIREKVNLDAVLSEDMARLIEKLGLRKDFDEGRLHCYVCGEVMNYTNVKLVFPTEDRSVGFLCSKPECFVEFALKE